MMFGGLTQKWDILNDLLEPFLARTQVGHLCSQPGWILCSSAAGLLATACIFLFLCPVRFLLMQELSFLQLPASEALTLCLCIQTQLICLFPFSPVLLARVIAPSSELFWGPFA